MDLVNTIETNFTIFIGVFVTLAVMGITTLFDIYKNKNEDKNENSLKSRELKPSFDMNERKGNFSSKGSNVFSEFSNKLSSLVPKKASKNNFNNSETKNLNPDNGINKIFSNLKGKLSLLSLSRDGKGDNLNSGKSALKSNKKSGTSKLGEDNKASSFDIDQIVRSKKDEFDFEDDLLTEMSTSSSIKDHKNSNKDSNAASLNNDLTFDDSEFDIGFGEMDDGQPQDDLLFNTGAEKIALADERDSLLDSLKKDIVITNENKIDFMTSMKGVNLDVKLIRSDLEDVSRTLKTYRQRSNHN